MTEQNFDGWWLVDILPEEEDAFLTGVDQLMSFRLVAVKTGDGPRIGYLEAVSE